MRTGSSVSSRAAAVLLTAAVLAAAPTAVAAPGVSYSTLLGGSGNESDLPTGAGPVGFAVDRFGNRYLAGTTSSTDFPTTAAGAPSHGGLDVFVTKIGADGRVVYSTHIGGSCNDFGTGVAVDAAGDAYVTGRVDGDCPFGGSPGVLVAKLDPDGAVVFQKAFGSTLADTSIGEAIAVDDQGHVYVTGAVRTASYDFPTTPGTFRQEACPNVYSFAADVFVAKLSASDGSLLYSTLVCGRGDDVPNGIAVDGLGRVHVAGTTGSSDFPMVAALQNVNRTGPVGLTGFVFELDPTGARLVFSTYLGGSGDDVVASVAIDAQRNLYLAGETTSTDFPTTAGVVQEHPGNRLCLETCSDAFVTKLAPDGAALVYSTYLYGELDDAANGVAVDAAGNAHVVGSTVSLYFPLQDAFQTVDRGLADAFVAELSPDATRILLSSYLGGSRVGTGIGEGWDEGRAIAVGADGRVHVAGYTQSRDFPTTADAAQPHLAGGVCDFFGTPCGDVFLTTIAAAGAGSAPAVTVRATPASVAPGAVLTASWAGIPSPTAQDHLRMCRLGVTDDAQCGVASWWPTGSAAAGTVQMLLPAELAPGWYDVRLIAPDPRSFGILSPIGRSSMIRVGTAGETTTTTTLPGRADCEIDPAICQHGDPCVADACVPGVGCASIPVTGLDGVVCACRRPTLEACRAQPPPAAVGRRQAQACAFFDAAAAAPKKATAVRRLQKAIRDLDGAAVRLARAVRKHTVSAACGEVLGNALGDATSRATAWIGRS